MKALIGKYFLEALLGEGAMGAVYQGHDTQLGAPVAVKVIHEHLARDPLTLDRFKSEAVIQARLQHPNVVRVQDFVQADGRAAIVMEYVDGRTLSEVLTEQTGPMPYERCLSVMRQVLGAVGHAHRQGIVHRDLKPSNIMVQWYGDDLHVKVTDFGIAKVLGEEKSRTGTHAKMGTLAYMSPEQIRSPREVDHRADIYSLGCTLYEMATGVTAYDANTEYELMSAIVTGSAPRPRSRYPHIGEGFEGIIVKAMSVDRAARYQSCEEFWKTLAACPHDPSHGLSLPDSNWAAGNVLTAPPGGRVSSRHSPSSMPVDAPAGSRAQRKPDQPQPADETRHLGFQPMPGTGHLGCASLASVLTFLLGGLWIVLGLADHHDRELIPFGMVFVVLALGILGLLLTRRSQLVVRCPQCQRTHWRAKDKDVVSRCGSCGFIGGIG